jgi:solute carrier family 35 (UDP-sugar transporter), member A1/2/3
MLKLFCSMAMVSLVVLVIQNSLLVIMTRLSRTNVDPVLNYHTSTLVLNQECAKMLMCLIIYAFDDVWKQLRGDASSSTTATNVVVGDAGDETSLKGEGSAAAALSSTKEPGDRARCSPEEHSDTQVFRDVPAKDAAAAASVAKCSSTNDHPIAVIFGEEEPNTTSSAGPSTSMRRNAQRCLEASPPPHDVDKYSLKPTDSTMPRKSKLRFLWMRAQAAVTLYCSMLKTAVIKRDTLKLLMPAFLFNMQNFLIFVGLSNLDAVSFQVWSQTKLLSTALFSVWLLHRKLSTMQWLSMVLLTVGVLGAQLGAPKGEAAAVVLPAATPLPEKFLAAQRQVTRVVSMLGGAVDAAGEEDMDDAGHSQPSALIGIAACVLSGLSSSYAGVYFEKVVKTTSPTLSIRNIQLSVFGIPFAFVSMLLLDVFPRWYGEYQCEDPIHWNIFRNPFRIHTGEHFGEDGNCPVRPFYFWQRYDHLLTWGLVGIHAFGGLLVAIVVKYADNILKGFATGVAVIVSGMMSSVIWGYKPTPGFVFGAFLVIGSSIMFHKFEPKR